MTDNAKEQTGRYKVSGNIEAQYLDDAQTVLANKKGVADLTALQVLEEEALARAYETLLSEVRIDTRLTCDLVRHIHERIFGELYDWAGRWRTVTISKGTMMWPPPTFLDQAMQELEREVLTKFPAAVVQSDETFCTAAGEIQGEFLAIHPFREGNARTIKLLTDLLAAQTGRPLLVYDDTEGGRDRFIEAARAAIRKDYNPMTVIIRDALAAAKQPPRAGPGSAGASPPGTEEALR